LPALGEKGESSFSQAADRSDQCVAGPVVNVEFLVSRGLLHGGEDAVTCAFVPAVGQHGHFGP
jgi:hypothetical protein